MVAKPNTAFAPPTAFPCSGGGSNILGGHNLILEKLALFVWPSHTYTNEISTFISRVPQLVGRSRLVFWVPLGSPFKNTSKVKKCQKSREIAFFVRPSLSFPNKMETLGGHISSTPWSWKLPSGFLDAPWIPLQKSIFLEKVTRGPLYTLPGRPFRGTHSEGVGA